MFTRRFWALTAEQMIRTFAQTLAAVLVASGAGLLAADWWAALSAAGMAAVVSVLTSVGSLRIGPPDSPSVVRTDPTTTPPPVQAVPPVPATQVPAAQAAAA